MSDPTETQMPKYVATPYEDDIPLETATAAHRGTSFDPDRRGRQERADYVRILVDDLERLAAMADTEEKRATLAEEFPRYREGLRTRWLAELAARSRCVSTMIAGPANFPTARMQKRNATADRRQTELLDYRRRAVEAIERKLNPELRPIMSGDADAVERLKAKIEEAEKQQERMKAANSAIRKAAKSGEAAQAAALVALGYSEALAAELLKGDCFGNKGYAPYEITNNAANIRRMKQRAEHVARTQAVPATSAQGSAARLEDCPPENRVRLFFPGKPEAEVRDRLKRAAFRWTPSLGCWQAYRNPWTLEMAQKVAGLETANA